MQEIEENEENRVQANENKCQALKQRRNENEWNELSGIESARERKAEKM